MLGISDHDGLEIVSNIDCVTEYTKGQIKLWALDCNPILK